jgi:hypothetical protein
VPAFLLPDGVVIKISVLEKFFLVQQAAAALMGNSSLLLLCCCPSAFDLRECTKHQEISLKAGEHQPATEMARWFEPQGSMWQTISLQQ